MNAPRARGWIVHECVAGCSRSTKAGCSTNAWLEHVAGCFTSTWLEHVAAWFTSARLDGSRARRWMAHERAAGWPTSAPLDGPRGRGVIGSVSAHVDNPRVRSLKVGEQTDPATASVADRSDRQQRGELRRVRLRVDRAERLHVIARQHPVDGEEQADLAARLGDAEQELRVDFRTERRGIFHVLAADVHHL